MRPLVVGFGVVALLVLGCRDAPDDPRGVTVADAVRDLGEVAAGSEVPLTFTLVNHSRRPARVVGFGGC